MSVMLDLELNFLIPKLSLQITQRLPEIGPCPLRSVPLEGDRDEDIVTNGALGD